MRKYNFRFAEQILQDSREIREKIVFSDGDDLRLVYALKKFLKINNSECILLGNANVIQNNINEAKLGKNLNIKIIDPLRNKKNREYSELLEYSLKKRNKTVEKKLISRLISNNSFYASLMLKAEDADCGIAGSISSTLQLMKAIINVLGVAEGRKYLSGAMIEEVPDCKYGINGIFLLSDVAIIPEPKEEQLLEIILSSYETAKSFFRVEPKIGILSYSTKGSAKSLAIDKISKVIEKVKKINDKIMIDGELQLDAAIIPKVSKQKSPESIIKGNANVLIFPCLDAANIGCKLIYRLAKAKVYGTIIQGASKPFNDLSRGCSIDDIVMLSAMTLLQLNGMKKNINRVKL